MNTNPLSKGIVAINSTGVGTVTRKMVRERAVELAVINGRAEQEASKSDWEQAKRELTGGSEMDPEQLALESAPESERWDPVPGSTGHQVPNSPSEDQDDEGRSESEQLVEKGVEEASQDQMLQAVKKQRADD
jgi:hypothetical protein